MAGKSPDAISVGIAIDYRETVKQFVEELKAQLRSIEDEGIEGADDAESRVSLVTGSFLAGGAISLLLSRLGFFCPGEGGF